LVSPETPTRELADLALQALLLLGVLLGVFVPLVAWAEYRQAALVSWRGRSPGVLAGFVQPLADTLKLLAKGPARSPGSPGRGYPWVPILLAATSLLAFAAVPWAGRYTFGDTSVSPILADVRGGVLFVFSLAALGALATVWAGVASGGVALLGSFRSAARALSGELAVFFSLLPMLLIYGSLRLGDMVHAQDTSFAVQGFWDLSSESGLRLPAWGIFLNPPALVLVLTAATLRMGLPPFDAESVDPELEGGTRGAYSGAALVLFVLAARLQLLLVAALVTLIFLGGWTIPWLPQATFVDWMTGFIGSGVANAICLALHLAVFGFKMLAVVVVQLMIGSALPRMGHDRAMDLCWKFVVPVAFLDLILTAAWLHRLGGAGA
jgi:NADH-quinone oxidoreductase subunit H